MSVMTVSSVQQIESLRFRAEKAKSDPDLSEELGDQLTKLGQHLGAAEAFKEARERNLRLQESHPQDPVLLGGQARIESKLYKAQQRC